MKKRTILVIVLMVVIGCGSMAVLPHFLFRYGIKKFVPASFVEETFISRAGFDLLSPVTVYARGCVFVVRGHYFLHAREVRITFRLLDLFRGSKPFVLRMNEMYVVADGSAVPIADITVRAVNIDGIYKSPGTIEIKTAHGEGEFGRFDSVGFLDPQRFHIDCQFYIANEYMRRFPFVPLDDIDPAHEFYRISALIDGTYVKPNLTVSSDLFNFSMKINEKM